jgi:hypothetical protein
MRVRSGSKNGSNAMERNGTAWDNTVLDARENPAFCDCAGRSGTQRRDL